MGAGSLNAFQKTRVEDSGILKPSGKDGGVEVKVDEPFEAKISVNKGRTPMPPLAFVSHTLFLHIGNSEFFLAWLAVYAAC